MVVSASFLDLLAYRKCRIRDVLDLRRLFVDQRYRITEEFDLLSIRQQPSVNLDGYPAVTVPRVDRDRIIRVVRELKCRPFPGNSCICSVIYIVTRPGVCDSEVDLKIGLHDTVIKHGIRLTDSSAILRTRDSVGNTRSLFIAFFRSPLTDHFVKVKLFSRLQNDSVEGFTYQIDIGVTVLIILRF